MALLLRGRQRRGQDPGAAGHRVYRPAADTPARGQLRCRLPADGEGLPGGQGEDHWPIQLQPGADRGNLGSVPGEARCAANRGAPLLPGAGAEEIPQQRGHGHPGLVPPGPRGQGAAGGTLIHGAGKEVQQDQRPDYPAVAHSGREHCDSRLQKSRPHQG